MSNIIEIKISKDFSDTPGGRYKSEGEYSGEEFRDNILIPQYDKAIEQGKKLVVNLDGCYGLATSFLEEAFGGLVRKKKDRKILDILEITSSDRPNLREKVISYINEANINE